MRTQTSRLNWPSTDEEKLAFLLLQKTLSSKETWIREGAIGALGDIGGEKAKKILNQALEKEADEKIKKQIQKLLDSWKKK